MIDIDLIVYEKIKKENDNSLENTRQIQLEVPSYDYYIERDLEKDQNKDEPKRVIIIDI